MLTVKDKEKIIKKFRSHESDTGSSDIQAAILSEEIKKLSSHLKKHRKDNHSRRGLLKMVAKRKRIMDYLKKKDVDKQRDLSEKIGLKRK